MIACHYSQVLQFIPCRNLITSNLLPSSASPTMAPFVIDFIRNQYTALPYPTQSFSGQTILVTGSNTGLGFEAAQHFVRLGASKVILAVRSLPKGEEAAEAIAHATGRQDVCEVWGLDMADFESVKRFVKRIEEEEKIDVALLNASISKTVFEECNGTEASIAVNVYGTFLLAIGLLPTLRKSAEVTGQKSKLTIVTSDAHFFVSPRSLISDFRLTSRQRHHLTNANPQRSLQLSPTLHHHTCQTDTPPPNSCKFSSSNLYPANSRSPLTHPRTLFSTTFLQGSAIPA